MTRPDIYLQMRPAGDTSDPTPDVFRPRFETCFRDHYADVLAFSMRRISGRETAEDVVADTFAVAWRRRDRIPDPVLPWLYGIAIRVIANQRRSIQRRSRLDERLSHEARAESGNADLGAAIDARSSFAAAFAGLSEAEREVLRLAAWDGLGTADAAQVLGCSPSAYRVRLYRARRKLGKQLEAAGHSPEGHQAVAPPNPAEETR